MYSKQMLPVDDDDCDTKPTTVAPMHYRKVAVMRVRGEVDGLPRSAYFTPPSNEMMAGPSPKQPKLLIRKTQPMMPPLYKRPMTMPVRVIARPIVPKKNAPPKIVTLNVDELFEGDDGDEEEIAVQTTSQQPKVRAILRIF